MCYYQNIHYAHHFALLNLLTRERESHTCGLAYPGLGSGSGSGEGPGDRCFAHSCCRVRRLVVILSCEVGGPRLEDDELCAQAFIEDVFVPVPREEEPREEEEGGQEGGRLADRLHTETVREEGAGAEEEEGGDVVDTVDDPIVMEFWPEDRPGAVVRLYSYEPAAGCADE
ncbi:hypothetical protein F5B18DRAFT_614865 [Nemania serpens]|nr:hypothetical protein F5B18DRAFT_614865 [Nemania serpens]